MKTREARTERGSEFAYGRKKGSSTCTSTTRESGWGSSETFGQMAKRDNVLGTSREDVALRTAAFVVGNDDRIRDHLG